MRSGTEGSAKPANGRKPIDTVWPSTRAPVPVSRSAPPMVTASPRIAAESPCSIEPRMATQSPPIVPWFLTLPNRATTSPAVSPFSIVMSLKNWTISLPPCPWTRMRSSESRPLTTRMPSPSMVTSTSLSSPERLISLSEPMTRMPSSSIVISRTFTVSVLLPTSRVTVIDPLPRWAAAGTAGTAAARPAVNRAKSTFRRIKPGSEERGDIVHPPPSSDRPMVEHPPQSGREHERDGQPDAQFGLGQQDFERAPEGSQRQERLAGGFAQRDDRREERNGPVEGADQGADRSGEEQGERAAQALEQVLAPRRDAEGEQEGDGRAGVGGAQHLEPARAAPGRAIGGGGGDDAAGEERWRRRGRRRKRGQALDQGAEAVDLGGAARAGGEVGLDARALPGTAFAVEVALEVGMPWRVHGVLSSSSPSQGTSPWARSFCLSMMRARWIRALTVPIGTPSTRAISSYGRSCWCRSRMAVRESGGSSWTRASSRRASSLFSTSSSGRSAGSSSSIVRSSQAVPSSGWVSETNFARFLR